QQGAATGRDRAGAAVGDPGRVAGALPVVAGERQVVVTLPADEDRRVLDHVGVAGAVLGVPAEIGALQGVPTGVPERETVGAHLDDRDPGLREGGDRVVAVDDVELAVGHERIGVDGPSAAGRAGPFAAVG